MLWDQTVIINSSVINYRSCADNEFYNIYGELFFSGIAIGKLENASHDLTYFYKHCQLLKIKLSSGL